MIDNALDIDLYQARMLIAYYKTGMQNVTGTMEAFTRKLPKHRRFLVVCGVERIIEYLKNLRITTDTIDVFKQVLPDITFDDELCNYLLSINFSKELSVRAIKDGDLVFANEPVVSITGPIGIAQYVEKKILSILNHDIRIASKAARIYIAARGKPVAEFGGRRGADGMGAEAARAAFIGGFSSSSNVLAYKKYGIPCSGTMGHVWVMSHLDDGEESGEDRAYKNWNKLFNNSTYLPDTYDVLRGADKVLDLCKKNIGGIRLDVDRLSETSFNIKRKLNNYGEFKASIGATNDLNEYKIKNLLDAGCPIDWFGVGTEVVSTPDAPTCNFVYKLVEVNDPKLGHEFVAKLSDGDKATLPGAKQIFRNTTPDYKITHDTIVLAKEWAGGILEEVNINSWNNNVWTAFDAQLLFKNRISDFPAYLKLITNEEQEGNTYPVLLSDGVTNALSRFKQCKM